MSKAISDLARELLPPILKNNPKLIIEPKSAGQCCSIRTGIPAQALKFPTPR